MAIRKTSLRLDFDAAKKASEILQTKSLTDTVDRALNEVINRQLRARFVQRLASGEGFDWGLLEQAWGGDH